MLFMSKRSEFVNEIWLILQIARSSLHIPHAHISQVKQQLSHITSFQSHNTHFKLPIKFCPGKTNVPGTTFIEFKTLVIPSRKCVVIPKALNEK